MAWFIIFKLSVFAYHEFNLDQITVSFAGMWNSPSSNEAGGDLDETEFVTFPYGCILALPFTLLAWGIIWFFDIFRPRLRVASNLKPYVLQFTNDLDSKSEIEMRQELSAKDLPADSIESIMRNVNTQAKWIRKRNRMFSNPFFFGGHISGKEFIISCLLLIPILIISYSMLVSTNSDDSIAEMENYCFWSYFYWCVLTPPFWWILFAQAFKVIKEPETKRALLVLFIILAVLLYNLIFKLLMNETPTGLMILK